MELKEYDGKLVRLTDLNNEVWEGYVTYCDKDYSEHEYGKNEECLKMINILFFKNHINSIEEIDNFSDKYGLFEESVILEGIEMIKEVFDSGNDLHIIRLLMCLQQHLKNNDLENKDELEKIVESLVDKQLEKINVDKDRLMEEFK